MPSKETSTKFIVDVADPMLGSLLRGGFALPHDPQCGLVILLRGKPGTGKSTLALQILDMVRTEGNRCYYTLEQSKEDLRFKLASMLAAQAIHNARKPQYDNEEIICDLDIFLKHLQNKLNKPLTDFEGKAKTVLENMILPLYGEPNDDQRKACIEAEYTLGELLREHLKENRIKIWDGRDQTSFEGPFGAFRSRVVLASRMLDKVLQEPSPGSQENGALRNKRPIVVVDGLSLLSTSERETLELQRIVERLRRCCKMGILVYEPNEDESTSLDHHADMVIELARRTIESPVAYLIHEISIRKARYQEAALGQHQFKIRSSGLAFFPSLHFQVHHYNYMDLELRRSTSKVEWMPRLQKEDEEGDLEGETIPCMKGSLIDMICNPQRGESVVLLGSRNSFKTQLCLDFLACGSWGCWKDPLGHRIDKGLLISLIDNAPDIERGLSCPWKKSLYGEPCKDNCPDEESALIKHARSFCQRPGCITPSEFFHYIKERIEPSATKSKGPSKKKPLVQRLVFWDLTQMDYRFPLFKEDKMLLPALMDMFKTKDLKSLFMGAGNAQNTRAASAMADHVLFCWRSPCTPSNLPKIVGNSKEEDRLSFLMLYVDRTSASSHRSGKALYCLPICTGDKLDIPLDQSQLEQFLIEPSYIDPASYDGDMIKRITDMQGVT